MPERHAADSADPAEPIDTGSAHSTVETGVALCLSGGGYRAMLFHLGVLWRLYEAGTLSELTRISSVSGGSITAATLALAWQGLSFDPDRVRDDFVATVVEPVRSLADRTLDAGAVVTGALLPGVSIAERIAAAYDRHLFHGATLQDLPDRPRFVINATNVQSGALWRFMKPYMRDWKVGEVRAPTTSLATAVAASSAFPPFLSPVTLELDHDRFTPGSGAAELGLKRKPFTTEVVLTDGGVYDNLGLETAYKRYDQILVSDAGGQLSPEAEPDHDWARHAYRVLNLIDHQVRSLRKRQLIGAYERGDRSGAYWGIRSALESFGEAASLPCPRERTMELAGTPTRLARLDETVQEQLVNWGYAVCDAALRKHVDEELPRPAGFPYPRSAV